MSTMEIPLARIISYDSGGNKWGDDRVDLAVWIATEVCYIFLETKHADENLRVLKPLLDFPDVCSGDVCTKINGYFGCKSSVDDAEVLQSLSTWFQILTKKVRRPHDGPFPEGKEYLWNEMRFFTFWSAASNTCRVLCIDTPLDLQSRLRASLQTSSRLELKDPFAMLRPLLDEIVTECDTNTWRVTKAVRDIEKTRHETPDFEGLFNLSRHTEHIVEVEAVAIETIQLLVARQEKNFSLMPKDQSGVGANYSNQAQEYLKFQLQLLVSLKWRAQASRDRLKGEITLAYNLIVSTDNQIMKSITILTMIFLPGTYVSAMFSTTFFSFGDDGWEISQQFWIYWVVVIPLTLIVVAAWWLWFLASRKTNSSQWLKKGTTQVFGSFKDWNRNKEVVVSSKA